MPLTLFGAYLVGMYLLVWAREPWQASGMTQYALAFGAWGVGAYICPRALADRNSRRLLAWVLLGVALLQFAVCSAQLAGIPINHLDAAKTGGGLGNRANGTLNHPNNLGKAMLLLMVISLALFSAGERRERQIAGAAALAAFVPLAMGQGRAAIAAAALAAVCWALFSPSTAASLRLRIGLPLVLAVFALPFVGEVLQRAAVDPDGGARPELTSAAWMQIRSDPFRGTGPNSFVEVVQDRSSAVAEFPGYPVHNAFLLTAAELGVVGAALFWLTVVIALFHAWKLRRAPGIRGGVGLAVSASVPGLYVLNSTGWGMLSGPFLPLWFTLLGLAYAYSRAEPDAGRPESGGPASS